MDETGARMLLDRQAAIGAHSTSVPERVSHGLEALAAAADADDGQSVHGLQPRVAALQRRPKPQQVWRRIVRLRTELTSVSEPAAPFCVAFMYEYLAGCTIIERLCQQREPSHQTSQSLCTAHQLHCSDFQAKRDVNRLSGAVQCRQPDCHNLPPQPPYSVLKVCTHRRAQAEGAALHHVVYGRPAVARRLLRAPRCRLPQLMTARHMPFLHNGAG